MADLLIFGSSGALGRACLSIIEKSGWTIQVASRDIEHLTASKKFQAVIWAQGKNLTKPFVDTTAEDWSSVLDANLMFVIKSLKILLERDLVDNDARLVVISSIWSKIHRSNKSAYIVSKSALNGLVKSVASDLSYKGIAINSVSPGVVDTPMTRANLSLDEIAEIKNESLGGNLVTPENIAHVVEFLISRKSDGINAQDIVVDNGWAHHRNV